MDNVKVTAQIRRSEWYDIEITVPDWYEYSDIEQAVYDKYQELQMEGRISPTDEEEEIWDIAEENIQGD